jgi:hypothetical protein
LKVREVLDGGKKIAPPLSSLIEFAGSKINPGR